MSSQCASRASAGLITTADDLIDCQHWLSKVPTTITSMNAGLETLQFQSLSVNIQTANDIMGGTQDNGTHAFNPARTFANAGSLASLATAGSLALMSAIPTSGCTRSSTKQAVANRRKLPVQQQPLPRRIPGQRDGVELDRGPRQFEWREHVLLHPTDRGPEGERHVVLRRAARLADAGQWR